MKSAKKNRLDQLLVDRDLAPDLETARRLIMAGLVHTGDRLWDKPGEKIPVECPLSVKKRTCPYASLGGLKLARALESFALDPSGWRCLDVGASTGGFTDVLLQKGAGEVIALDVAYGIFEWRLRQDKRVKLIERTNFRLLPADFFPEPFDLIVVDVSFISLGMILPRALSFLKPDCDVLALIKPQFEASADQVEAGGIVSDRSIQMEIIEKLKQQMKDTGIFLQDLCQATVASPRKNMEFFSRWRSTPSPFADKDAAAIESYLFG